MKTHFTFLLRHEPQEDLRGLNSLDDDFLGKRRLARAVVLLVIEASVLGLVTLWLLLMVEAGFIINDKDLYFLDSTFTGLGPESSDSLQTLLEVVVVVVVVLADEEGVVDFLLLDIMSSLVYPLEKQQVMDLDLHDSQGLNLINLELETIKLNSSFNLMLRLELTNSSV